MPSAYLNQTNKLVEFIIILDKQMNKHTKKLLNWTTTTQLKRIHNKAYYVMDIEHYTEKV